MLIDPNPRSRVTISHAFKNRWLVGAIQGIRFSEYSTPQLEKRSLVLIRSKKSKSKNEFDFEKSMVKAKIKSSHSREKKVSSSKLIHEKNKPSLKSKSTSIAKKSLRLFNKLAEADDVLQSQFCKDLNC